MNLVKCENEHIYDADKFFLCPHCTNQIADTAGRDYTDRRQGEISTEPPDSRAEETAATAIVRKTVGWLVCIEGTVIGKSFTLCEGDNYIGRAASMDIALLYEPTVSREKHAVITYHEADNSFVLHAPGHTGQTFCNGTAVTETVTLKNRDVLTLGNCSLIFAALCDSSFHWTAQDTKSQEVLP